MSKLNAILLVILVLRCLEIECFAQNATDLPQLPDAAANLYAKSLKESRFAKDFSALKTATYPTSDGRSFYFVWKGSESPRKWIVSLHGAGRPARGFAMDDATIWQKHLNGREIGLISLQWWLGTGDLARDFLSPNDIYREIDLALQSLEAKPGKVMLHGFSRGATNTYAVAAFDAGKGKKYFSLIVANSGGVAIDYPPTAAIINGVYGNRPLERTKWITVAGALDPNPERDGIAGMRKTSTWLREQGAVVLESIEDPKFGHGALNLNPQNALHVLNVFLEGDQGSDNK